MLQKGNNDDDDNDDDSTHSIQMIYNFIATQKIPTP